MEKLQTHYDNLQVKENASIDVIKGAYRYLSQKWHPDKNPDNRATAEQITKIINEAYKVLSDPILRQQHDNWIEEQRIQNTTPPQHSQASLGFIQRSWLMLLFGVSAVMLLGVLPYQYITGQFQWTYVGGILLWIGVGRYSYVHLFHAETVAKEKIYAAEQQRTKDAEPRHKATRIGWLVGVASWPVSFAVLVALGQSFESAALISTCLAPTAWLLGWIWTIVRIWWVTP